MNKFAMTVSSIASIALIAIYATNLKAETICKGKDEQACKSLQVYQNVPACKWMPERQRADGGVVKAHCRGSTAKVPEGAVRITETNKQ